MREAPKRSPKQIGRLRLFSCGALCERCFIDVSSQVGEPSCSRCALLISMHPVSRKRASVAAAFAASHLRHAPARPGPALLPAPGMMIASTLIHRNTAVACLDWTLSAVSGQRVGTARRVHFAREAERYTLFHGYRVGSCRADHRPPGIYPPDPSVSLVLPFCTFSVLSHYTHRRTLDVIARPYTHSLPSILPDIIPNPTR